MVTSRDVRQFAQLHDVRTLGHLIGLVAARSGGPLVLEDLARGLGASAHSIRTYLSYLETVFLCSTVPAWSTNPTSRITKTPKVFLTDSASATCAIATDERSTFCVKGRTDWSSPSR